MNDALEIVPYDPDWPSRFEAERLRIEAALGPLAVRIDHHGSTSVPGLAAKPILDIQVSVRRLHPIEPYARKLEGLGYAHRPHADDSFAPFFHRPAGWPHSHHLHVVESGGEEERRTLAFRDYLRDNAAAARAYEVLKRELAPRFSAACFEARQAYAEAKGAFIEQVVARALEQGYPREPRDRCRSS